MLEHGPLAAVESNAVCVWLKTYFLPMCKVYGTKTPNRRSSPRSYGRALRESMQMRCQQAGGFLFVIRRAFSGDGSGICCRQLQIPMRRSNAVLPISTTYGKFWLQACAIGNQIIKAALVDKTDLLAVSIFLSHRPQAGKEHRCGWKFKDAKHILVME